jgi:hypothetical protein
MGLWILSNLILVKSLPSSEPDKGMYDALTKDCNWQRVIGLMHSDDEFYDMGSLKIVGAFTNALIRMAYMEMVYMLVTMQKSW